MLFQVKLVLNACSNTESDTFFLSLDVTFIPFGPEAGDNETLITDGQFHLVGPLTLEIPLVFYLQEHSQLYVIIMNSMTCCTIILFVIHKDQQQWNSII